jgi:hypothetical protein
MTWRIGGPICIQPARMAYYEQLPGGLSRQLKRARGEDHRLRLPVRDAIPDGRSGGPVTGAAEVVDKPWSAWAPGRRSLLHLGPSVLAAPLGECSERAVDPALHRVG